MQADYYRESVTERVTVVNQTFFDSVE